MIVILAYCLRDQDITLQLFDWINELGGCSKHQLLLCHDARCPKDIVAGVIERARGCFESVKDIVAQAEINGWPQGANYMFKLCAAHVEHTRGVKYFLWLEPDAIPLRSDWIDKIEAEYLSAGKPFMGDDVNVTVGEHQIPRHMSGVGVYENPIHKNAGQINWAHDTAWDMVAKDQIIPNAHFTKLIEHAWRHPPFTELSELKTQIRPEAVLFHASKDGSLIKLLREQRKEGDVISKSEPIRSTVEVVPTVQPVGTTDIFIRTYPADYPWLAYCLQSIQKYCSGFRKIWVVSTTDPGLPVPEGIEWKVMNEESEDGYLAQQIHKLYADVILDYTADYILFGDSDTLFREHVTPETFFRDGKPIWYYTPYDKIETPWKPIIEKFMNRPIANEFMRRHPLVIPRWLFPKLREYCHQQHGRIISDYIANQPYREFSEFNALGAYAYEFHRDRFTWVNTLEEEIPEPVVRQFFSWGGITPEVKAEIETILGANGADREVQTEVLDVERHLSSHETRTQEPSVSENGEMSVGDHVRALSEYADLPWKRQNVIRLLKKANLVPKYTRRKKLAH